jgi:hypothetical protein
MTQDELIENLQSLRSDVLDNIFRSEHRDIYPKTLRTVIEAINSAKCPVLRRWTKMDGTPPDGLYLDEANPKAQVAVMEDGIVTIGSALKFRTDIEAVVD